MPAHVKWPIAASVALAVVLSASFLRVPAPPSPSDTFINVRWTAGLDPAERAAAEARYALLPQQLHGPDTWVYQLTNPSTGNIEQLVRDRRVADTQGIDRQRFRLATPEVTVAEWVTLREPVLGRLFGRGFAGIVTTVNVAPALIGLAFIAAVGSRRARALLSRGVPQLSARSLASFRVVFGVALGAVLLKYNDLPSAPFPRPLHRSTGWFANWEWVHAAAERGTVDPWLVGTALVALAAFVAGIRARVAYLVSLLALTAHVLIVLQYKSAHDWGLPLLTLWGLALVPWGSTWMPDAWWRAADADLPTRRRGFAIWFPGLMLGVAFAAAAYAKLDSSGSAWVLGGAVQYHFVEDARQAPTTWGLWVASRPGLAVLLSLATVLVEGLFLLHVFVSHPAGRLVFGIVGLLFMSGFYAMQGVLWLQWWVLFLCFLPWQWLHRPAAVRDRAADTGVAPTRPGLAWEQGAFVAAAVVVQLFVSANRVESEPFVSDFGMYSWTWPSRAAFDEQNAWKYRRYTFSTVGDDGSPPRDATERFAAVPGALDAFGEAVDRLRRDQSVDDDLRARVTAGVSRYAALYGDHVRAIEVRVTQDAFAWEQGDFVRVADQAKVGTLDPIQVVLVKPAS